MRLLFILRSNSLYRVNPLNDGEGFKIPDDIEVTKHWILGEPDIFHKGPKDPPPDYQNPYPLYG